ncbi:hypothetical protein GCM10022207_08580 [Streptomyces lannensis]|uniref:Uncharacterized protein n=1 Tax=Streptomyces lannensis TaxID=766498 RepID=A0ABP7JMV4_9ACTN
MFQAAAGQGDVCLDRIESQISSGECIAVATEHGALVKEMCLLNSRIPGHVVIVRSLLTGMGRNHDRARRATFLSPPRAPALTTQCR